ncbi:MAG: trigger factor family protein, partial [Candidatus Omnitrophica bacterium]|nr:trigger factor family protein [Candidatus Omnitrophota bacterium]
MRVEVKKLDKLKRTITVEVEGEEFLKEKNEIYGNKSKDLKVPGFRPGSAPLNVLERHHSKFLKEELLKESLPNFYRKALEDKKILPAGMPHVYDIKLTSDALSFSADFETRPEVKAEESSYKGIKIKDKNSEVKEIEIEKILTNLKEGIKKAINK